MIRPELSILIPCHSLEDFPIDLGESDAAGLLNAFAAAYHPALLAATRELPAWKRADEPPFHAGDHHGATDLTGKIVIIPACSSSWLPHRWSETVAAAGAVVVEGVSDRRELVSQLLAGLLTIETAGQRSEAAGQHSEGETPDDAVESAPQIAAEPPAPTTDPASELADDFHALGIGMLQAELLTRRMHYYSNLDSGPIRLDVIAAAEAAIAGDGEQARRRLSRAFELLLDARERYFPVDCFLIDLCLVVPRLADKLPQALSPLEPSTLLATAADWEEIAAADPQLVERLAADWQAQRVGLAGGGYQEGPTSLLPLESVEWELDRGLKAFARLFGRTPTVWASRRFGFSTLLPQILDRAQISSAVHAALDDGFYPDDELSRFRWEGCDGVAVDAFSRIPLAADSATGFLRFSQRLSESMEQDQSAALMFARWPEVTAPWLDDLRRIHRYAPVFGRMVTLETFFEESELPGRTHRHAASSYFPPYLAQSVARSLPDPIGRFGSAIGRRHRFETAALLSTIAAALAGRFDGSSLASLEDDLERAVDETGTDAVADVERRLDDATSSAGQALASSVTAGGAAEPGVLLVNPLAFPRTSVVELPADFDALPIESPVRQVQPSADATHVVVDLPPAGFIWLKRPATPPASATRRPEPPTAEDHVLRNEFFEVHLGAATGGIAYIKGYGRSPKRLSQQLAYRFSRKRRVGDDRGDDTWYSVMAARSVELTCTGPALAEAVSTGDLIDPENGQVLATFRQTTRVWRGRSAVDLDVVLEPAILPSGDPWTNYYACRFAWNDPAAVLTRSVQQTAQPVPDGRFDAAHYIEIAEDEMRTTVVPGELPFHRRIDDRMLDTLLVVDGETRRRFHMSIACDEGYPLRPALDAAVPPIVVAGEHAPANGSVAGWFLQVDARNVQITSVRPTEPCDGLTGGLRIRLLETEGRGRRTRLSCFRTPSTARLVNLAGERVADLPIDADGVSLDLHSYEVATVELRF